MRTNRLSPMLVVLLLLGALVLPLSAATRLGLNVTQEELDLWRTRMTDNTNTINGFTYQSIYLNRIKADADTFVAQSHPGGDSHWEGYTGAGCAPDMNNQPWAVGRINGALMFRSAFTFLLTGNAAYANPVRTEFLQQISEAGTDWTNQSKWCRDSSTVGGGNQLEMTAWMSRMVLTYDYLLAGGYTGFSAGEKTSIEAWLHEMAEAWGDGIVYGAQNVWAYPNLFDTPQNLTCVNSVLNCTNTRGILYFNGPTLYDGTFSFNNQGLGIMPMLMAVGILTNDSTMITRAERLFTAVIKAGTFDNGAMPDFQRWFDCTPGCPGSMWGHAGGPYGALVMTADLQARTGNTALYDYMTANVTLGQTGATVGLETTVNLWADMANQTVTLYGTTTAGGVGPGTLLTWDSDIGACCGNYYDFVGMAANMYYQNTNVSTAMERASIGGNSSFNGCNDAQYGGCFSGVQGGQWPDLPFMYGNMEGTVNPYSLASSSPAITITAPNGGSNTSTGTTPLTTLAGSATDDVGVTSVTVTCSPSCGSPTVTCGSCGASGTSVTWSVSSLNLTAGANVITATAHDADTQTETDQITVTLTSAAPTVTITTDGGNGAGVNFTTVATPLTTLAGTASDDVAVSSVTVACSPSCGSPTVTGTTSWSVASLPLTAGANVITVTATDGDSQTDQDSITVTYSPPADIVTDLDAYYKLNETSGTTANDSSGQTQHGTLVGFPASPWTTGHVLGGLTIDGVDAVVTVPASAVLNDFSTLSLAAWIHPTSFGPGSTNPRIFHKTGAWWFAVGNDTGQEALFFQADRWATNVGCWQTPIGSIDLNVDTHVAVTYSFGSTSNIPVMYINGTAQTVTDAGCGTPSGSLSAETGVLHLGNRADQARPFVGWLDEMRVYGNRILGQADVDALVAFTESVAPTTSPVAPGFSAFWAR